MLQRINETMQVRMTLDEANHINKLLERDEAKPLKEYIPEYGDERNFWLCPNCNGLLLKMDTNENTKFCMHCGQRLDVQNIAF